MKEIKTKVYGLEGCAITVEVEGSIEEYSKCFVHIFNNVRENKELLKVTNYYGSNDVTVYCEPDYKDSLVRYLKNFGAIKSCEKVLMYKIKEPDFDIDKYDEAVVVPFFDN